MAFSRLEKVLLAKLGVDVVRNPITRKAAQALISPIARFGARAGVSVAGTALGMGRLAFMNPYVLGGTAIFVAYHERDKIRNLLEQGYEIVEPAIAEAQARTRPILEQAAETTTIAYPQGPGISAMPLFRTPRKKSSFNKAVGAGMRAVKASTSYGKKGTINAPTKAFTMVTKVAASVKKKLKAPKKGIRKKVWRAIKRFL